MKKIFFYTVLSIGAFAFIYPFVWMISASLSSEKGLADLTFFPIDFTFKNYIQLVESIPIFRAKVKIYSACNPSQDVIFANAFI